MISMYMIYRSIPIVVLEGSPDYPSKGTTSHFSGAEPSYQAGSL
jgi:hypothetical protein